MSFIDDVYAGLFCVTCGQFIDEDPPGAPRRCDDCASKYGKIGGSSTDEKKAPVQEDVKP